MRRLILIHYGGEIGIKGANKEYFVNKLLKAIKLRLESGFKENFKIRHSLSRVLIELPDKFAEQKYCEVLDKIFGIKNYKFVFQGSLEMDELAKEIWGNLPGEILNKESALETFCVRIKRSMVMPMKSFEMERDLGAALLEMGLKMKVNLKNPDLLVDIEVFNNCCYFSFKKYQGQGGFPPNSQSKLVALLSSGIDSPVAAYSMMKRGARIIFVHFHGYPYTDMDEMNQVKDLVKILGQYQFDTKLYLIPYGQVQRNIATNLEIPGKIRTVLYRRTMLRIAEEIAHNEKAKGLVTGDSFGQVASQTPENIFAIHDACSIPVFQPLISFDKEDITKVAEKIGTYEISKLPCKDTCSMFMPKNPELKANVYDVRRYEQLLPMAKFVETALKQSEIIYY